MLRDTDKLLQDDKAARVGLRHKPTPHLSAPFCPTLRQPFFISPNLHAPQSLFSSFFCVPLLKKNLHLTPDLPPLFTPTHLNSPFSILNYLILHFNPYTLNVKFHGSDYPVAPCLRPAAHFPEKNRCPNHALLLGATATRGRIVRHDLCVLRFQRLYRL